MQRPLIGLTGRRKKGHQIVDNLAVLADFDVDLYYANYAQAVFDAGGMPVHLPMGVMPKQIAPQLDGILLTGGADIGPDRYGARSETDLYPPEPDRDDFELALLAAACGSKIPALGICRGLQLINVHAGGTLHQHVPAHARFDDATNALSHRVAIAADSVLHGLYGASVDVNSLHHQTVDRVGTDLAVTAHADDGTVEGLEHATLPVVAVQWHPEMLDGRAEDPIFRWLVDAATARHS